MLFLVTCLLPLIFATAACCWLLHLLVCSHCSTLLTLMHAPLAPLLACLRPTDRPTDSLGAETHIVEITLPPGARVRAQTGAMLFMSPGVDMQTNLSGGDSWLDKLKNIGKRMLTGSSVFLTDFSFPAEGWTAPPGSVGHVTLGAAHPSKIIPLDLAQFASNSLVCAKNTLLAASPEVEIDMNTDSAFSTGFFSGQGFVLQQLKGKDVVLLQVGGGLGEGGIREV